MVEFNTQNVELLFCYWIQDKQSQSFYFAFRFNTNILKLCFMLNSIHKSRSYDFVTEFKMKTLERWLCYWIQHKLRRAIIVPLNSIAKSHSCDFVTELNTKQSGDAILLLNSIHKFVELYFWYWIQYQNRRAVILLLH